MTELLVLVIHDEQRTDEVVRSWIAGGVTGITILDSSGWTQALGERGLRDDLPLMPSLRSILRGQESRSRTIFSVVGDGFDLQDLIARTEAILGPLDNPESGIFFSLPVSIARGLQ